MFKYTVKFKDFEGVDRTKDLVFNLSKTEIILMQQSKNNIADKFKSAGESGNPADIIAALMDLIRMSYGEIVDSVTFRKNETITADFEDSLAYQAFIETVLSDTNLLMTFFSKLIGRDLIAAAKDNTTDENQLEFINELLAVDEQQGLKVLEGGDGQVIKVD